MDFNPRLIEVAVPARPRGIVLVLHGGASREGNMTVSPTQLSVLRMKPVARQIKLKARGELAIFRLLNSRRGWDATHTPVQDAIWGLNCAGERVGGEGIPTCVVGHSLGGRAALLVAGQPGVRSVVALAPWVYPTEAPTNVEGRSILFIHGTRDRVADPQRAHRLADVLARRGAIVTFVDVLGGKHAMLAHHRSFDGLAAEYVALTLLGLSGGSTMRRIEAGEGHLRV
jgi:acetyl esterase/lipase